jgi:hypothetical protein
MNDEPKETTHDAAYEFTTSQDCPTRKPWSDRNMNQIVNKLGDFSHSLALNAVFFVAISTTILVVTVSSLHKTKIALGGRLMTVHPTIFLTCFTLVACVAGHVDALVYDEGGASELAVR